MIAGLDTLDVALLVAGYFTPSAALGIGVLTVWRRERRVAARAIRSPLIELDLSRARRRQVARRKAGR